MATKREIPDHVKQKDIEAGIFLRKLRKEKQYTQADIANYLNISAGNYTRKEKGQIPFTAGEFLFLNNLLKDLPPKLKRRPIHTLIPRL